MACPGGCVNGGGQIRPPGGDAAQSSTTASLTTRTITTDVTEAALDVEAAKLSDPEGFTDGWMTPAASSTSEDVEMLNGVQEEGDIAGWKGTTKEWVRRVEKLYWSSVGDQGQVTSVHQGQALGLSKEQTSQQILATLINVVGQAGSRSEHIDTLANIVVEELCKARGTQERREDLLRTQYRAVQDEAISGLAVQW